MNCRINTHAATFSTLLVAIVFVAVGTANAKPFADPMPPDLICKNTGGTWNSCGSGCGPATCANPEPGPICNTACVALCQCPPASPLWDTAQGCVPHTAFATMAGDNDGDGYTVADGDCNDNDVTISPAATETCDDGVDNDCNGFVDDGACSAWAAEKELCAQTNGTWNECSAYCNPATCESAEFVACDALCTQMCICPKAAWLWDDSKGCISEEECDGANPPPVDADLDGFTVAQGDCDDNNPAIHPFSAEICNGADDNCNGVTDEGCETPEATLCNSTGGEWQECGDTLEVPTCENKNPDSSDKIACLSSCACPAEKPLWDGVKGCITEGECPAKSDDQDGDGYTLATGDCNDNDALIHPAATEGCDTVDNDCDGQVDEDGCETEEPVEAVLCTATGGQWDGCGNVCGNPTCAQPEPDTTQCDMAGCGPTCTCPGSAPLWDPALGCVAAELCPKSGNEGGDGTTGEDGDTTGTDDSKGGVSPIGSDDGVDEENKDSACHATTNNPINMVALLLFGCTAVLVSRRHRIQN